MPPFAQQTWLHRSFHFARGQRVIRIRIKHLPRRRVKVYLHTIRFGSPARRRDTCKQINDKPQRCRVSSCERHLSWRLPALSPPTRPRALGVRLDAFRRNRVHREEHFEAGSTLARDLPELSASRSLKSCGIHFFACLSIFSISFCPLSGSAPMDANAPKASSVACAYECLSWAGD